MVIHLCHGFMVRDRGAKTVNRVAPYLDALELDHRTLSYPWASLLSMHSANSWAIAELVDRHLPGDGVIAHSNGAHIALSAAAQGAQIGWMILVNPALYTRAEFPGHVREIVVFHSPGDQAVEAGRWWRRATAVLPWRWGKRHHFGAMGKYGYAGLDRRVRNVMMPHRFAHSGVWQDVGHLEMIADTAAMLSGRW